MSSSPQDQNDIGLIFHIGMGKTGTSSIQAALSASADTLNADGAEYLGMGFEHLGPSFSGPAGVDTLARSPKEKLPLLADRFVEALSHEATPASGGAKRRYVMSNERFFQHVDSLAPFIARLNEHVDFQAVAYLRHPYDWLPSAYSQWGLDHKGYPGPIQPFGQRTRVLIQWYDCIRGWHELLGDRLVVREHTKSLDAVADFGQVAGLTLAAPERRVQQRREPVELLVRAMFNDRIPTATRPDQFDAMVLPARARPVVSRREMLERCFDYSERDEVLAGKAETFRYIDEHFALGFSQRPPTATEGTAAGPDPDVIDDRLLDYLLNIVLDQSGRIHRLERRIAELAIEQPVDQRGRPSDG